MLVNFSSCRGLGGLPCSGNGICSEGVCYCYIGHSGPLCEIDDITVDHEGLIASATTDGTPSVSGCPTINGQVCNGHGSCVNRLCTCETPWSGESCERNQQTEFCNENRHCAECTAFELKCAENCNSSTVFRLVKSIPPPSMGRIFCRHKSSIHHCSFYYQLSKEIDSGKNVVLVQSCPDWLIALVGSSAAILNKTAVGDQSTEAPALTTSVSPETTSSAEESSGDSGTKEQSGTSSLPNSVTCASYNMQILLLCTLLSIIWYSIAKQPL